jgi:hypothetical protein
MASDSNSKDDLEILHSKNLDPIGDGTRLIAEGSLFSFRKDMSLSFFATDWG